MPLNSILLSKIYIPFICRFPNNTKNLLSEYPQPPLNSTQHRRCIPVFRPLLPLVLSLNAGYVDTAGFLALQGLFTAHVTGNFVTLGASLVLGTSGAVAKLLALPVGDRRIGGDDDQLRRAGHLALPRGARLLRLFQLFARRFRRHREALRFDVRGEAPAEAVLLLVLVDGHQQ